MRSFYSFAGLLLCLALGACGTYVPQINEAWEPADVNDQLALRIKKSIYCELRSSIFALGRERVLVRGTASQAIPDNWGVQMTMTLTVDETGSLNPSGSYNRNITPAFDPVVQGQKIAQSLSLPFTTQLQSQAVRTDTYYSFYAAKKLKDQIPNDNTCSRIDSETGETLPLDRTGTSYLLSGNVGIYNWLKGALYTVVLTPSSDLPKSKSTNLEVLQYNIKFTVVTAATANPMWRLAPVTTGIGGLPLVSGSRTRTHQLLVTLGPAETANGQIFPALASNNLHSSGQIDQAIANGFRSAIGR